MIDWRAHGAEGRVSLLLLTACSAGLPAPEPASQPTAAYEEVPYAPPPARVERVPGAPRGGAVWIDGEWTWGGTRWEWEPGRWVLPLAGAGFAKWSAVRRADGALLVAKGTWRGPHGEELSSPPPLATARAGIGSVVNAEGERETTGPNRGAGP